MKGVVPPSASEIIGLCLDCHTSFKPGFLAKLLNENPKCPKCGSAKTAKPRYADAGKL